MRAWTHRITMAAALALAVAAHVACQGEPPRAEQPAAGTTGSAGHDRAPHTPDTDPSSEDEIATYSYEVVNVFPHDPAAFTQGLVFHEGTLLESTGQYGSSSLRAVDLRTGKILKKVDVPAQFFAEGITIFRGKIFQLTWQNRKGFIYDPGSFRLEGEFPYSSQGWGLTNDDESQIMSDGTEKIRFLDPSTYAVRRVISVYDNAAPLTQLNELEYIKGEIYANIWHTDRIVRIDPRTGKIRATIDLTGLLPDAERGDPEAVLNGIAYDKDNDRLFVTGKLWPKIFEVRLKRTGSVGGR